MDSILNGGKGNVTVFVLSWETMVYFLNETGHLLNDDLKVEDCLHVFRLPGKLETSLVDPRHLLHGFSLQHIHNTLELATCLNEARVTTAFKAEKKRLRFEQQTSLLYAFYLHFLTTTKPTLDTNPSALCLCATISSFPPASTRERGFIR